MTSAYDIAIMSRELLSHDLIRDYTGIWMDTLRGGQFQLANTNKLIYYYQGATGLKTGSTQGAGFCISASACRDGMELIAVILGSETSSDRFESAKTLLNYGFGGWAMAEAAPDQPIPAVPVTLGETDTVQPVPQSSPRLLVTKDQMNQVTSQVTLAEQVEAPVQKGDVLGSLTVTVGDQVVQEIPLVAGESVPRRTFGSIFRQMLEEMTG